MRRFKVALKGSKGAGKNSLISRLYTGDYGKGRVDAVVSIPYQTNKGGVVLDFTEEKAEAEILVFDLTSMDSLRSLKVYIEQKEEKVPLILCGNKIDLGRRSRVMTAAIKQLLLEGKVLCYYDISAKSMYNIDKPVIAIIRYYMGEDVALQAR